MIVSDFHLHTTYSDGRLSMRQLVDLAGQTGHGCIAITDHLCEEGTWVGKIAAYAGKTLTRDSFDSYIQEIRDEAARAKEVYGMIVLPGFEITKNSLRNHRTAHMLAIGVDRYISADLEVSEIIREIKNSGGVAVAAHPTSSHPDHHQSLYLWDRRYEFEFDAWEMTLDGRHLLPDVIRSNLPKLATSDLHRPEQISSWKTIVDSEKNPNAILQAIRNQQLDFRNCQFKSLPVENKRAQFEAGPFSTLIGGEALGA